jgi:hypothetical protein
MSFTLLDVLILGVGGEQLQQKARSTKDMKVVCVCTFVLFSGTVILFHSHLYRVKMSTLCVV